MTLVHMLVVRVELQRETAMRLAAASSLRDVRIIFAYGLVFEHLQLGVNTSQFGLAVDGGFENLMSNGKRARERCFVSKRAILTRMSSGSISAKLMSDTSISPFDRIAACSFIACSGSRASCLVCSAPVKKRDLRVFVEIGGRF